MLGCKIVAPLWLPLLGSNQTTLPKTRKVLGGISLLASPTQATTTKGTLLRPFLWLPLLGSNQTTLPKTRKVLGGISLLASPTQATTTKGTLLRPFLWLPLLGSNQRLPAVVSVTTSAKTLFTFSPMCSGGTHIFFTCIL